MKLLRSYSRFKHQNGKSLTSRRHGQQADNNPIMMSGSADILIV